MSPFFFPTTCKLRRPPFFCFLSKESPCSPLLSFVFLLPRTCLARTLPPPHQTCRGRYGRASKSGGRAGSAVQCSAMQCNAVWCGCTLRCLLHWAGSTWWVVAAGRGAAGRAERRLWDRGNVSVALQPSLRAQEMLLPTTPSSFSGDTYPRRKPRRGKR